MSSLKKDVENLNKFKEQFVSYEIALDLRELGFDELCLGLFKEGQLNPYGIPHIPRCFNSSFNNSDCIIKEEVISAPLYQQVQTWLRTKNINLEIYQADSGNYVFSLTTTDCSNARLHQAGNFPYFEAMNNGIIQAIKILKKR